MSDRFNEIRDDYYQAWFRFHPEAALDVGVGGFERLLRPYGDEEQGALLSLNKKLLDALDEIAESELNEDERIDMQLMRAAAFLEIEQILQFDWRKRDPEEYLPLHAIYQLTVRTTNDFAVALQKRLEQIPDYLLNARHFIGQDPERIPAPWLESAITAVASGIEFLKALPKDAKVAAQREQLSNLDDLIEAAVTALERYALFLERDIGARAGGDFAVGAQRFAHLLQYRHFLDIEPSALHSFGNRLFDATEQELREVCRKLTGGDDLAALDAKICQGGADAESYISAYRQQMEAARWFTESRGLLTFPPGESLQVVETPVFLRHRIPFAAYEPPTPGDDVQEGRYFVTPGADTEAHSRHNLLAMMHTSVHEGYPGHHLQFTAANHHPAARTLPRMLNKSATLYEGWALYCEQLMCEQGFLGAPESEYLLLKDRLWRALRIVIDVSIQTTGLGMGEATATMSRRLGFSAAQAEGELLWYSRAPTVPMGYATGWSMINIARDALLPEPDPDSLRSFHDGLLAQGSCALSLVLTRAFGKDVRERALEEIRAPVSE